MCAHGMRALAFGQHSFLIRGDYADVPLDPVLFPSDSGQQVMMENVFLNSADSLVLSRCVPS